MIGNVIPSPEMTQKKKSYRAGEIYPNSPLIEVICELRFQGDLSIECDRAKFQKKIKGDYPNLKVPLRDTVSRMVMPHGFENAPKTAGVNLAIDRFSYYEKEYRGHKKFINEFLRLWGIFLKLSPEKNLTRLGWRYVNAIPFIRDDGLVPQRYFFSGFELPDGFADKLDTLSLLFSSKVDDGDVTSKIETVMSSESKQEAILLDFDFAVTDGLASEKLKSQIDHVHLRSRELFEKFITDGYRTFLRGDFI